MLDCDRAPGPSCSPLLPSDSDLWPSDWDLADSDLADDELVERLHALLVADGGFTVDFRTARPVDAGLAVCADPARTLRFRLAEWSDPVIAGWLQDARCFVETGDRSDLYLGGWHAAHRDHVYLDVVRVVPADGQHLAETMGRLHRQHALFDLARRTLVPLGAA